MIESFGMQPTESVNAKTTRVTFLCENELMSIIHILFINSTLLCSKFVSIKKKRIISMQI